MAIANLDLSPQECMIIEDNERGIQAAKGSGAWLMEIEQVEEVNYENIMMYIKKYEKEMR